MCKAPIFILFSSHGAQIGVSMMESLDSLFLSLFIVFERGRQGEAFNVPLIYSFIGDSCMYPDEGPNPPPGCIGMMP